MLYVSGRCVFALNLGGLELIVISPGVDLQRDIPARMDFAPAVRQPTLMDAWLFRAERMELHMSL